MEHVCFKCNHKWNGTMHLEKRDKLKQRLLNGQWLVSCPKCGNTCHISAPVGKIIVCFADDSQRPESFKDNFDGQEIMHYHAFDTVADFMAWWIPQTENWDGMWYYVFDNGTQICSGAVDPYDISIWRDHFGSAVIDDALATCKQKGIVFDESFVGKVD